MLLPTTTYRVTAALGCAAVLSAASCSRGSSTPRPASVEPAPAQPTDPTPGQGCVEVTIAPPCVFEGLSPVPMGSDGASDVRYVATYRDAQGRVLRPYLLRARQDEQGALEAFFRANTPLACSGRWVSAPCNDTPQFQGFPLPPVGRASLLGQ